MKTRRWFSAFAALAISSVASAQTLDPLDPLADGSAAAASMWTRYGDINFRYDRVAGLPNAREDFDRGLARIRYGLRYENAAGFEFGAAVRGSVGTDDNRDNRRNLDNHRSDAVGIDEVYVGYALTPELKALLGKTAFPVRLSPMLWDQDLRPIAAALDGEWETDSGWTLGATVGYFAGNHLYGDDSRIHATQLRARTALSASIDTELLVSFLGFDDLETLVTQQLGRTNRVARGALVSDYRLIDAQLIVRSQIRDWPLTVHLDGVRNAGADDQNEGARLSVVFGDRRMPRSFEFGYAIERIQRDAVVAAFGDDDWWFKSRLHGYMPWVAYGIDESKSVRLAGFIERRDDLSRHTRRVLLDFNWEL
jgi:hypothetical protein